MARYMVSGLSGVGHEVTSVTDAIQGKMSALTQSWDLIIIDRLLPNGQDGLDVVRAVRKVSKTLPIMLLSSLVSIDERINGLNEGANDYLAKPFSMAELIARTGVLLNINKKHHLPVSDIQSEKIVIDDLVIDLNKRTAERGKKILSLQPREFHLLEFLARHQSQVMTRSMLLEAIWDTHLKPETNVIEAMVSRLRSKLDKSGSRPLLHTIRGIGYKLEN